MLRSRHLWGLRHAYKSRSRQLSTSSQHNGPVAVEIIAGSLNTIDVHDFRERAFAKERPLLITTRTNGDDVRNTGCGPATYPAAAKWFKNLEGFDDLIARASLQYEYLTPFKDAIVPYELLVDPKSDSLSRWIEIHGGQNGNTEVASALKQLLRTSDGETFHRFNAPLSLFLQAATTQSPTLQMLYIAQCQIADLPRPLQDDLPTPHIVKQAGKGDIYDANIWLGLPPTYTPLHKDPNPNLFVQLAGVKEVRMFPPAVGRSIFSAVQQKIGQMASESFRGYEMMEGLERHALEEAVWGEPHLSSCVEATVHQDDALFIPKGWWHSIRSVGKGITGSVNWVSGKIRPTIII